MPHSAARAALERHATARAALDASAEALRIVEERFRSGIVKTVDVLAAATSRREAEMRELTARADACAALLRLALASGRTPGSTLEPDSSTSTPPTAAPAGEPS